MFGANFNTAVSSALAVMKKMEWSDYKDMHSGNGVVGMLEVEIPEMVDSEYKDIQSGNGGVDGMLKFIFKFVMFCIVSDRIVFLFLFVRLLFFMFR